MSPNRRNVVRVVAVSAAAALLASAVGGGYWWGRTRSEAAAPARTSDASPGERKVLYWYDPMVPDQHFDKPGKSPFMDMQLLPKYADEAATGGVRVDAGLQQNVGIRTATVERGRLASTLRVPGTLAWDLREETVVSARSESLVSRVLVRAPYTRVARGQPLATVLAPSWSSALAEAQALRQAESASARELRSAAQQRLRALGVPGGMGRDGSVTLAAPHGGIVTEVLAREGQTVMPGTPLFRINGTATLWLEAAIPQTEVARLRPGTPVEAVVSAVPGQTFAGEVEALLPQVDAASRTQQARIVLRNPDGVLAPGMFAEVTMRPEGGAPLPLLPTEALISTGTDSRVIVQDADGGFRPARVRTGRSGGGRTEILAGLEGGERVVVSGQFLIDSEASLSGALERLDPPLPQQRQSHAHPRPTGDDEQGHRHEARPRRQCPVSYWYDPMKPDRHFDKPGKSPFMDMMLVPKFAPGAASDCAARDVEGDDADNAGREAQP